MSRIKDFAAYVKENNTQEISIDCCTEELAELIQALQKFNRNKKHNIPEELSHVILMSEVIKQIFEIDDSEIEKYCLDAVDRMKKAIDDTTAKADAA